MLKWEFPVLMTKEQIVIQSNQLNILIHKMNSLMIIHRENDLKFNSHDDSIFRSVSNYFMFIINFYFFIYFSKYSTETKFLNQIKVCYKTKIIILVVRFFLKLCAWNKNRTIYGKSLEYWEARKIYWCTRVALWSTLVTDFSSSKIRKNVLDSRTKRRKERSEMRIQFRNFSETSSVDDEISKN